MLIVDQPIDRPRPDFQGRRAFVVGSGPSLDALDLALLRPHLVLALNAAYTIFADHRRYPGAWWVFRDRRAATDCMPRLAGAKRLRLITTRRTFDYFPARGRQSVHALLYDERSVVHERTVAEDALQLARRAGCSDAVLVGVDCHAPPGRPYAEALSWKPCAWYDPARPVEESRACASFLKALRSLAASGRLEGFPVHSASATCDAFPHMEFARAVEGRAARAV